MIFHDYNLSVHFFITIPVLTYWDDLQVSFMKKQSFIENITF